MEDLTPETWVAKANLVDADPAAQYIASLFWSFQTITTVGFGDIFPETPIELLFANIWMIVGVLIYSFIIASLTTTILTLDKSNQELNVNFFPNNI